MWALIVLTIITGNHTEAGMAVDRTIVPNMSTETLCKEAIQTLKQETSVMHEFGNLGGKSHIRAYKRYSCIKVKHTN